MFFDACDIQLSGLWNVAIITCFRSFSHAYANVTDKKYQSQQGKLKVVCKKSSKLADCSFQFFLSVPVSCYFSYIDVSILILMFDSYDQSNIF